MDHAAGDLFLISHAAYSQRKRASAMGGRRQKERSPTLS
jgi:hypothetical protein